MGIENNITNEHMQHKNSSNTVEILMHPSQNASPSPFIQVVYHVYEWLYTSVIYVRRPT